MKLPVIYRRWLSEAEIAAWESFLSELEKELKGKEEDLKMVAEAQGWRLDLGPDPFISLPAGVKIKPLPGGGFEMREPGGQWNRLEPRRDIPERDLISWQMCSDVFTQIAELRQAVKDLPAAVAEFKHEHQRGLDRLRAATTPAARAEALAQLRAFYEEQKEVLPTSCHKEILDLQNYIPPSPPAVPSQVQPQTEPDIFTRLAAPVSVEKPHSESNFPPPPTIPGENQIPAEPALFTQAAAPIAVEIPILETPPPAPPPADPSEDQILAEAALCAHAAAPGEVEKLIEAYPHLRDTLWPLLERAQKRFAIIPDAMMAADAGNFLKMAEIYSGDMEYAENLMVFLETAFVNFLSRAREEKALAATASAVGDLRARHHEVDTSLRLLQNLERSPARITQIYGFARENAAALREIEAVQREVEERQPPARVKAPPAADTATTTRATRREQEEQALEEIKAQCDKAETSDDIKAIKESFIFYHELSGNSKFRRRRDDLVTNALAKVDELTRVRELQRNLLAQVQTQSSQANSLADIQEIEAWVREELASLPVPKPALEKQLAGLLADAQKRIDAKRGTLAFWAGVQEEQYVHLAIVFTDMIGSTALNSRFGDATWDAIRSAHFRQARTFIERLHGWYIKDVGDAVVAVFKNAVDALSFAMELEKTPGHEMIRIKAAAHIGTVIIRGNDIFGNEVNLASRIQNMAREGGVWMSEGVRAEWRSRHGKSSLSFTRHPDVELKGLDEPITLWSIPSGFQLPQPVGAMTETKPPVEEKPLGFGSFGRIFGAMISRKPPPQAAPSTPPPRVAPATPPRVAAKVVLEQADALARQARADEIVRLILQNPNLQAELLQRKQMAENLQSEILAQAANFVDKASPDEIKKLAGQYPHVAALKPLEEAARKAAGPAARKGG